MKNKDNEIAKKIYDDILLNIEKELKEFFKRINKKTSELIADEDTGIFYIIKEKKVVWSGDFLEFIENTWNGTINGLSTTDKINTDLIIQYKKDNEKN